VVITGVSILEDEGRSHRYLDADGYWAGGTELPDQVRVGRVVASAATPGMSGAPVMTLPADTSGRAVVGVVSARYNSRDGWGRDSVWVTRTEDLAPLLTGLCDVTWLQVSPRTPRVKRAAMVTLTAGVLLAVLSVFIFRSLDSGLRTPVPGKPIPAGSRPYGIAITRNGLTAYVTDFGSDTVTPINLRTNTPGAPITVGSQPYGIAITPNGKTAYVTNFGDGTVTPINLRNDISGAPIRVGHNPQGIAITPDGQTAYVADHTEALSPRSAFPAASLVPLFPSGLARTGSRLPRTAGPSMSPIRASMPSLRSIAQATHQASR
jgi:YVTN family beta-propeller protein